MRIGNYEDGVTGRHDAARVLGPFLDGIATAERRKRVAAAARRRIHEQGRRRCSRWFAAESIGCRWT